MQGVRGGWASASTSASGAHARGAGGRASASTSAEGANARSPGGRALPAPAPKERMQGVRGGEPVRAPAPKEPMQDCRVQTTGGGDEEAGALALEPVHGPRQKRQKTVLTVSDRWCPGTRAAAPLPAHTALLQKLASQNRSCAPLLPRPLCWCCKACQRSRGQRRLCMHRCRPPSWRTPLPRWSTPSPLARRQGP